MIWNTTYDYGQFYVTFSPDSSRTLSWLGIISKNFAHLNLKQFPIDLYQVALMSAYANAMGVRSKQYRCFNANGRTSPPSTRRSHPGLNDDPSLCATPNREEEKWEKGCLWKSVARRARSSSFFGLSREPRYRHFSKSDFEATSERK